MISSKRNAIIRKLKRVWAANPNMELTRIVWLIADNKYNFLTNPNDTFEGNLDRIIESKAFKLDPLDLELTADEADEEVIDNVTDIIKAGSDQLSETIEKITEELKRAKK